MNTTEKEETARRFFEEKRWPNGIQCPQCGSGHPIYKESRKGKAGYYRCPGKGTTAHPPLVFTVRTGTVLARSHTPLLKWFVYMRAYLLAYFQAKSLPDTTRIAAALKLNRRTIIRLNTILDELTSEQHRAEDSPNAFLREILLEQAELIKQEIKEKRTRQ